MGDFKIYQSIPEKGKIKVGSADVKKIYKGENWVWPPEDDSYIPPQRQSGDEPYFISNVVSDTFNDLGSSNGFALLKIKKIAPELFPPDGIGVGFEMVEPANAFSPLPDTKNSEPNAYTSAYTNKYRIQQVSDDYKYMYAEGVNPQGIDSIVRTEDFGQTWIEVTDPAIYNQNFDIYGRLIAISRNGKVICVPYGDKTTPYTYYTFAISRDYGVTWEKAPDLFYFFRQNSAPSISLAGIPDNDRWGFNISISAGGKYIYVIKQRTLNIYRSSDFGKTFNYITISSGLSDSQYKNQSQFSSVAVSGNGKRVFIFDQYSSKRYYASGDYGQTFGLKGLIGNMLNGSWSLVRAYSDYEGEKAIFAGTTLRDDVFQKLDASGSSFFGTNYIQNQGSIFGLGVLDGLLDYYKNSPSTGTQQVHRISRSDPGHLSSDGFVWCTIVDGVFPYVSSPAGILNVRDVYRNHNRTLVQYGYPDWRKYSRFLTSIPKIVNIT